jgi:SulP family sulfate permease
MATETTTTKRRRFSPKLTSTLASGYPLSSFTKDLVAGAGVGIVALPLAIVFAIGAGASPAQGLWTSIIAGFFIAALGGSRVLVSGPTGALLVITAGIIDTHGMNGLFVATLMAGLIMIVMGLAGLGRIIKFMPYPVTTGFTTGIGVMIAGGQLKDFLGLHIPGFAPDLFGRLSQTIEYLDTFQAPAFAVGLGTMVVIFGIRRLVPRLPAAFIALALASIAVLVFDLPVQTIGTRFGDISNRLPVPAFPALQWHTIRSLLPGAFTIAMLGSIITIMSSVVADGLAGDRHDPDMELLAQGAGNMLSSIFGGIPVTGAIARTVVNIKNGAVSPVSSMVHAVVLLLFTLVLGGLTAVLPLPALSGLLLVVAWDMSDFKRFSLMRFAPRSDLAVMMVTFLLAVAVSLSLAVEVGVVLALVLFLKRVSETSSVGPVQDLLDSDSDKEGSIPSQYDGTADTTRRIPPGLEIYEINGPFFFGTADFLQDVLDQLERPPFVFILRMRRVPAVDATGLNALDSFRRHCVRHGTTLILSGVREQPSKALESIGLYALIGPENICSNIDRAMDRAMSVLNARHEHEGQRHHLRHHLQVKLQDTHRTAGTEQNEHH